MSDFVQFIFSYLNRALYLAVPAVILCGAALAIAAACFKKKGKSFPWGKAVLWLALVGYLTVLAFVTVFRTGGGGWHDSNLHLFRAWREAWQNFSQKAWLNVLLNIAMFAPLGVLLPLFGGRLRKWYLTLGAGFSTSLLIEIFQYLTGRGLADVDDLFCNTLGCLVGYFLVMTILGLCRKNWKSALAQTLGLLVVLGGIGSPFLLYSLQELGNLPHAPAYRVSTEGTQWHTQCQLSADSGTLPIYRTPVPTKEECEAIGRRVLDQLGTGEIDRWYYNDEVYLRSRNRYVSVYYLDGSYDYRAFQAEPAPATEAPEVLREKLAALGIDLPEGAVLTTEESWYCFTADQVLTGDTLVDGTVRFRLTQEGTFTDLENHLLTFAPYRDGAVISPQAAAEKLMAGWITSGDWFEGDRPKETEIRSCTPAYQVDTKGFYQPVYLFEVAALDTNYAETVAIPALA